MVGADAALVLACYFLAYLFRFEFEIPRGSLEAFQRSWYFVVLIKISLFALFHLYRGMWRYTSLVDLVNLVKATFTSSAVIILAVLMVYRFQGYPRSVFLIDGVLTLLAIGGVRLAIRLYFARGTGIEILPGLRKGRERISRLLIVGAGDAADCGCLRKDW